jgi:hypothetical protein
MRTYGIIGLLAPILVAGQVVAQTPPPVTMPPGSYLVQARDSLSKVGDIGIAGWPFVLKSNGTFTLTSPDSLTFAGKLSQKDGMATYTDQNCADPGVYYVRRERGGYAFDVKSESCPGRDSSWVKLLFVPGKPGKSP